MVWRFQTDTLASPLGVPCSAPPWGTLDAVDLVSGKIRWSVPLGTTPEVLWETELPTSGNASPMSYQVRAVGRQFVVVAAGGHWSGLNPPGDHLVAFALPEADLAPQ